MRPNHDASVPSSAPAQDPALKESLKTVWSERALLVGIANPGTSRDRRDPLEELALLAETAGATVVETIIQRRLQPVPRTYIGTGKVHEVAQRAAEVRADCVLFDNELSPAQVQNLEKDLGRKVLDRTELILDIFATHARSRQAKLQVELAQLEYTLPRLGRNRGMDRTLSQITAPRPLYGGWQNRVVRWPADSLSCRPGC